MPPSLNDLEEGTNQNEALKVDASLNEYDKLPEDGVPNILASCKHLVRPNGVIVGAEIAQQLKPSYPTLLSAIPSSAGPAFLASIDGRIPITHTHAAEFIREFGDILHAIGVRRNHRVALVLPNGPELALAILAVSNWAACVPLSATGAVSELAADMQRAGCHLVIGPYAAGPLPTSASTEHSSEARQKELAETFNVMGSSSSSRDWTVHSHVQETAEQLNIPFVGLVPDPHRAGPFRLWIPPSANRKVAQIRQAHGLKYEHLEGIPEHELIHNDNDEDEDEYKMLPNSGLDEALVLFTSGTTGNKKLVAHVISDIITAAVVIALSWELQTTDVNCNLMPLFHVGGIVRQVYSPLVSGSAVICCPSFDADLFWGLLQRNAFNWYYAAPTMHQIILQTGIGLLGETEVKKYKLKMIANAAGGLLPSLAVQLRDTFGANVLPSYGMTECMPISSPPANYDLSKPGTSGVPVGPQVAILNLSNMEDLPVGTEGPICVRGEPCFRGYGVLADDPTASKPESFLPGGWFNTGDMGYLDEDGYLYITGRSKEVINRGGEIIAPMEVEEAVLAHPDVIACAAFAAQHDVLQEIVGIVIVPKPNCPRSLDLPALHAFVADKLAAPKWPQCLVFMEGGLPKSHTNKLLRVKLAQRLNLPEFSDTMSTWTRTFEAECPPQGAPLTDPIPCGPVAVDSEKVQNTLRKAIGSEMVWVVPYPQRPGALVAHVGENDVNRLNLIDVAQQQLHRYEVPTHVCLVESTEMVSIDELCSIIPQPKDAVASLLSSSQNSEDSNADPIVSQVQDIFLELLDLDYIPSPSADFFHIGGSSMRASQLASKIRKSFGVSCSGAEIFHHSTCVDLAGLIRSRMPSPEKASNENLKQNSVGEEGLKGSKDRDSHDAPFGYQPLPAMSGFASALFQLLPMFFVFPVWQIARYLLFFTVLLHKSRFLPDLTDRDFLTFLMSYLVFYMAWVTIMPLSFVLIKWIVIGRYQEGRYPIWGSYYLRWWLVDVCRKMILRGVWGSNDFLLRTYYRMLGANIHPGAKIGLDCDLAEYDLVTVGRNAAVELCTLRGFGVDNGAMILGKVRVGHESSVGIRSVVAPYTSIPDGQHLGPGTSSYDVTPGKALHPKHAMINRQYFPQPSVLTQIFLGTPIIFAVNAFSQIPPMIVLYCLLWFKSREKSEMFFMNWNELMDWLCDYRRIPFFLGIRIARSLLSPFFYMFAAMVCKWFVIGKFNAGPRTNTEWEKFRFWLASTLFSRRKIQAVADLVGRHYENVSIMYRMLGARIGKRVFWPGNQPNVHGLFDLLEIGDDCVFGSRSTILCATVDRCDKVILCAGANVSDNCIVLPGTVVGKNAVLGSNTTSPMGAYLPARSVWFGSDGCQATCLETGDGSDASFYQPLAEEDGSADKMIASEFLDSSRLPMVGDETTHRQFGKAFYLGMAKGYTVFPLWLIVLYSWLQRIFATVFHTLPLLAAVQFAAVMLYSDNPLKSLYRTYFSQDGYYSDDYFDYKDKGKGNGYYNYKGSDYDSANEDSFFGIPRNFDNGEHYHNFFDIYVAVLTCFLFTHFFRVVCWLIIEIAAKWAFMRRRKAGRYSYLTDSYAQRWELYQITAKIRKINRMNLLQFICGSPYMNWYIRLNGGKVGKDVCLYPTGADPFMPEPDLVKIGDNCIVDCASICCHLNTRGNFELAPIVLERNCTLRARSRVQQGVHMEAGSQLLEKSIAMTGEVIDGRSVWQGGPATLWFRYPDVSSYVPPSSLGGGGAPGLPYDPTKEGLELGRMT